MQLSVHGNKGNFPTFNDIIHFSLQYYVCVEHISRLHLESETMWQLNGIQIQVEMKNKSGIFK